MPSLVNELQQLASDSQSSITDLLRKAKIVASKLRLAEFRAWIEDELNGYGDKPVPEYRYVSGKLFHTDRFGTQELRFRAPDLADACSNYPLSHGIAEVDRLSQQESLHIVPNDQQQSILAGLFHKSDMCARAVVSPTAVHGVVEHVRNLVLEWSLRLEEQGITGDGLTFTDEEKRKAQTAPTIQHVGTLINGNVGTVGDITARNVNVGDYGSIRETIRKSGLSREARHELKDILDGLKDADEDEKELWAQKGMDWLGRNAKNVGAVATSIRQWFSPHLDDSEEGD